MTPLHEKYRHQFTREDFTEMSAHVEATVEQMREMSANDLLNLVAEAQKHLPINRQRSLVSLARCCQEKPEALFNGFAAARQKHRPRLRSVSLAAPAPVALTLADLHAFVPVLEQMLRQVIFEAVVAALNSPGQGLQDVIGREAG